VPCNDVVTVDISWMRKKLNAFEMSGRLPKDLTCKSTVG
jgi:hypothetical protein